MKKKGKAAIWMIVVLTSFFLAISAAAQKSQDPMREKGMMDAGMMGPGTSGPAMMGERLGGAGTMPMMRTAAPRMALMAMLYRWGSYFFSQRDRLGITETQLEKIESILDSHIKYAIRKDADRKILLMEVEELLVKDKVDLSEAGQRVKALEAIDTDIDMEGIRTLEQALAVLNPEQQKKMKELFRESTFTRMMRRGPARRQMMPGLSP